MILNNHSIILVLCIQLLYLLVFYYINKFVLYAGFF